MYLRKLTVSGFKSFADKIDIEFDSGVTVVVGPNGCGKSNISDAVRWVLGEQNPRKLRGSRMGDLIFNGTASRSPLGLAQVTLVFDNTDAFLPISYSEVAITRKLFRDGESEYLLNGTPCRLKDITDLFMDSGIGTHAYSLIEQGRVDQIINSRPQDRREIIEEAAGVSRYLHRQAEALRKLERTENDLVVVSNIINELERQKRSLKRQANQAERVQRYRRELKITQSIAERRRGRKILTDLSEIGDRIQEIVDHIAKAQSNLQTVRVRKAELVRAAQDLDSRTRECRDSYLQLNNRLEQIEKQIEGLRSRINEHRQLAERFRAEAEADRDRTTQEEERVSLADQRFTQISSELVTMEEEVTWLEREATLAAEQCRRTVAEGEEHKLRLNEVQRGLVEQRNQSREWERDHEFYISRLEKLSVQCQQVLADIETHHARKEEIEARSGELSMAISDLSECLDRINSELQVTQEERDARAKERNEVETAWQQKNSRLESLIRLQSNLEGFTSGVRFLLREVEKPADGLLHTVAEKISVEKGFERAIENALAEALEAIITVDMDSARLAIERLREEQKGRVAFMPNGRQVLDYQEIPETLCSLRHAPSLVQADEETLELIYRLIGKTLVVENLEEGLRYWDELPEGWRIVTQSGDVLDSRGMLVGGATSETSLLSRTAEIEELRTETTDLAKRRDDLASRVADLRESVGQIRRNRDEISERKLAAEANLRHAQEDLDRTAEQIVRAQSSLTAIEEEQTQIDEAIQEGIDAEQERQKILRELKEQAEHFTEEMDLWDRKLTAAEEARHTVQERLAELRMKILEQQKDRERWSDQRETISRHLQEMARSIQEKEEFISQQQLREKDALAEISGLEERLTALRAERDQLWTRIQDSDAHTGSIRTQIEAVEQEEKTVLESIQRLDEERNGLEQRRVRNTVEREYWERRIREMFDGDIPEDLSDEDTRADEEIEEIEATLRRRLERLGVVNELAIEEYEEVRERHEFLTNQRDDLEKAKSVLLQTTRELHGTAVEKFLATLAEVQEHFHNTFRKMFGGGRAELRLLEGDP
ncbi:MAG: chromosome segregation protein SMC, partial [bacterium]